MLKLLLLFIMSLWSPSAPPDIYGWAKDRSSKFKIPFSILGPSDLDLSLLSRKLNVEKKNMAKKLPPEWELLSLSIVRRYMMEIQVLFSDIPFYFCL